MGDLSLRGVLRMFRRITGDFSVKSVLGTGFLRPALESIAREEFSFPRFECIFGWTAAYEQIWTHIIVRIQLNPDTGIPAATMNNLETAWRNGIQTTWSNRWGCGYPGEATCRLTFEVQWVNANQHHSVRVRVGSKPTNKGTWDTMDNAAVASHEFGHMIGQADEYTDNRCPYRYPVNTGTIMDNNSNTIPERMMKRFAQNIGSSVIPIRGSVEWVIVPNVIQTFARDAADVVIGAGLVPEFSGPKNSNSWVFTQSPFPEHPVPRGSTVHMVLRDDPLP